MVERFGLRVRHIRARSIWPRPLAAIVRGAWALLAGLNRKLQIASPNRCKRRQSSSMPMRTPSPQSSPGRSAQQRSDQTRRLRRSQWLRRLAATPVRCERASERSMRADRNRIDRIGSDRPPKSATKIAVWPMQATQLALTWAQLRPGALAAERTSEPIGADR